MMICSYSSARFLSFAPHTSIHSFYQLMDAAAKEEGLGTQRLVFADWNFDTVYFARSGGDEIY